MSSNCNRCRRGQVEQGEECCGGCLALASSSAELRANWWSRSHRRLAEEVLLQASRQLRAIRSLDTALQSFSDSTEARLKRVVNSQRPSEPHHPPTSRSVAVLREAATKAEVAPAEEERAEEPTRASSHRDRSRSSVPDFGNSSESNRSSPRGVRGREPKGEDHREPLGVEIPQEERGRDRRERSRSRAKRPPRRRPHHRGGAKHQKHYRQYYQPGHNLAHQRSSGVQAPAGRSAREILDSDI